MKIKNILLSTVLLASTLFSCVSDKEYDYDENKNRSVVFSSSIGNTGPQTRAVDAAWAANDAIGIYMKTGTGLSNANIVDDAKNKHYVTPLGNGLFNAKTGADAIFFPMDNSLVDFIAYYPFQTGLTGVADNYKFVVDVTNQGSQEAIDLLYSNDATGKKNGESVHFTFTHKLTKVVFNIEGVNGVTSISGLKIEIEDMFDKAEFDVATGNVTADATKAKIAMKITPDAGNPLKALGEGIVIPTGAATRNFVFNVEVAGVLKEFTWDASAQLFEAGKKNTYNIKLDGQLGAIVAPGSTITDWQTGSNENIDIEIGGGTTPPAGDGTLANPFSVEEALVAVGQTGKWIEGYILGSSSKTKSLGGDVKTNIVLATVAGETNEAKWIIVDIDGSAVQVNLDIVVNPTLKGQKVKVQGNIVNNIFGNVLSMTNVTAQEGGATITPPDPTGNLLFAGSDFNNWAAFTGGLSSHGLKSPYAVQNATGGRGGSSALHLNGTPGGNDYVFTAINKVAFAGTPSKITFYIKGTSGKSLSLNVYDNIATPTFKAFNLESCTIDKTIIAAANNQYTGIINTEGQWVKVTLDLAGLVVDGTVDKEIFALKVGKTAAYDLLIDDITFE